MGPHITCACHIETHNLPHWHYTTTSAWLSIKAKKTITISSKHLTKWPCFCIIVFLFMSEDNHGLCMAYTCVIMVWQHCARMPQSRERSSKCFGTEFLVCNHELQGSNVDRFSVDKKNQLDVTFCILYFSSNSCSTCFGATMCPSSGADDWVML